MRARALIWLLKPYIDAARTEIGEAAFAAAEAEGRAMSLEQAVAYAQQPALPEPEATQQSGTSSTPRNTAGLTARERDVLRLVAQGLTDAQIAEQLVISPRTVNAHLTSIYGKLAVSSRSAATRYAIDHNLT